MKLQIFPTIVLFNSFEGKSFRLIGSCDDAFTSETGSGSGELFVYRQGTNIIGRERLAQLKSFQIKAVKQKNHYKGSIFLKINIDPYSQRVWGALRTSKHLFE